MRTTDTRAKCLDRVRAASIECRDQSSHSLFLGKLPFGTREDKWPRLGTRVAHLYHEGISTAFFSATE